MYTIGHTHTHAHIPIMPLPSTHRLGKLPRLSFLRTKLLVQFQKKYDFGTSGNKRWATSSRRYKSLRCVDEYVEDFCFYERTARISTGEPGKSEHHAGRTTRNAVCISSPSGTWHTNYKIAFYLHGCLENKIKKLCFALLCFGYNDCTVLFLRCQMGKGVRGRRRGVWKKREYNTNSILLHQLHILNLAIVSAQVPTSTTA